MALILLYLRAMNDRIPKNINFTCPKCSSNSKMIRDGSFLRKSDSRRIQRLKCSSCGKRFSTATFDPAYRQNKRKVNFQLARLLSSSVSLRRSALILGVSRKTVERKLKFIASMAKTKNQSFQKSYRKVESFQFDDLETIEHTKCKPLSITIAVEDKTRKILGFEVSQMPAKGHLARYSVKKYGYRKDQRQGGIKSLLDTIKDMTLENVSITSDEHPYYPPLVREIFPKSNYKRHKGGRGSITGQGELKKLKFDPLFSLNHTFAMLRANINRLVRKTWCTTKDRRRLDDHLNIYMHFHNTILT
jgi:transposase-like protein